MNIQVCLSSSKCYKYQLQGINIDIVLNMQLIINVCVSVHAGGNL